MLYRRTQQLRFGLMVLVLEEWCLGACNEHAAEGYPITGIISDSGLTSPTYLDFQNITEQGLGGPLLPNMDSTGAEKVGFYTNLESYSLTLKQ